MKEVHAQDLDISGECLPDSDDSEHEFNCDSTEIISHNVASLFYNHLQNLGCSWFFFQNARHF